jgi:hypothetical protein
LAIRPPSTAPFDVQKTNTRFLDKLPSGLGQFDHLVIAVEEQIAEFSLKLVNSPANRGLVDA